MAKDNERMARLETNIEYLIKAQEENSLQHQEIKEMFKSLTEIMPKQYSSKWVENAFKAGIYTTVTFLIGGIVTLGFTLLPL